MGPQDFEKKGATLAICWNFPFFFTKKNIRKNCHFQTLLVLLKSKAWLPVFHSHAGQLIAQLMGSAQWPKWCGREIHRKAAGSRLEFLRQRSRSSTCMPFWSKEEPSRLGKLMMIFWVRNLLLDWDAPFLWCQPGLLSVFMAASSQFSHTLSHQAIVPEAIPWHQDLPYWKARLLWLKIALWVVSCGVN